jgi:hypothetical protein
MEINKRGCSAFQWARDFSIPDSREIKKTMNCGKYA